jgi:predicted unusual protein kinase regulating ubiquinone biosynthesis (AarF/ABC1/UbiB family)
MLLDELNFRIEARQTDLFRYYGERRNRYVTAPIVYRQYSTSAVLVTEFIEGIFLRQILSAIQNGDHEFLDSLAARGYSLATISSRLLNIFYWQLFENVFFHADPHPSNVILQPDKIVLIDFGATGTITQKYRRDLMRFVRCLADDNIDGMVRNMIASLEPLPPLNMENYTNEMYYAMREYLFTARSEHSTWQEKSSGRAMMAIAEISRKYKIPMRADVLRYMRASFQFDSIVYRLYPQVDSRKEFKRYFRQRAKRLAKDNAKSWKKTRQIGIRSSLGIAIGELRERLGDVDTVISFVAKHTTQFEQLFQRRVTSIASVLGWGLAGLRLMGCVSLILVLWIWFRQHHLVSALCRTMNSTFGFAFGPEAARFVDLFPLLSERFWFWITGGLLITLFSLEALIRRLLTPTSKLE